MSDVILYAALKENERLSREYVLAQFPATIDSSFYSRPQSAGYPYTTIGGPYDAKCPQVVKDWKTYLSPNVAVGSSGVKVCSNIGNWRCGTNCTWTVPAGVTRAQFQLWGPGGNTSSNCCCGGAPFGPSGAYAVVQLDVVAGNTYTVCAGCAICCCANQNQPGPAGGSSFVTGPGLCICAEGGQSDYSLWRTDIGATSMGDGGCGLPLTCGQVCAPNSCDGWNFCWDSGNDDMLVCHAFSRRTWSVNCAGTGRNLVCYGINGLWPHMQIGSSLSASGTCSVSTPVFGFENCVCVEEWTSGTSCFGHCRHATQGFLQIPGAGGYATRVFGGCNSCGGDHGRFGMVCISWGGI